MWQEGEPGTVATQRSQQKQVEPDPRTGLETRLQCASKVCPGGGPGDPL